MTEDDLASRLTRFDCNTDADYEPLAVTNASLYPFSKQETQSRFLITQENWSRFRLTSSNSLSIPLAHKYVIHRIRRKCLQLTSRAFHDRQYRSVKEAWEHGFNEEHWRWGLVFNQGNDMNVSEDRVKERLRFIASRLLRKIYGNRHRDKAKVRFIVFQHGASKSFNRHYHILMAIDGDPSDWSDFRIAMTIRAIDQEFVKQHSWEKPVHVDWNWQKRNRYHRYVSRYPRHGSADTWSIL